MNLKEAITLLVDESRMLCGGHDKDCPRCQAVQIVIEKFELDESSLTPYPEEEGSAAAIKPCGQQ